MKKFCVIGNPIDHSLSPKLHNFWLKKNKIVGLKEKPKKYYSDYAITGLYYFDKNVIKHAKTLKPSKRNELEITDLLKKYLHKKKLSAENINKNDLGREKFIKKILIFFPTRIFNNQRKYV